MDRGRIEVRPGRSRVKDDARSEGRRRRTVREEPVLGERGHAQARGSWRWEGSHVGRLNEVRWRSQRASADLGVR
jgi:hypothetical protein